MLTFCSRVLAACAPSKAAPASFRIRIPASFRPTFRAPVVTAPASESLSPHGLRLPDSRVVLPLSFMDLVLAPDTEIFLSFAPVGSCFALPPSIPLFHLVPELACLGCSITASLCMILFLDGVESGSRFALLIVICELALSLFLRSKALCCSCCRTSSSILAIGLATIRPSVDRHKCPEWRYPRVSCKVLQHELTRLPFPTERIKCVVFQPSQ